MLKYIVNNSSCKTNIYPPASKESREVANLTERKNPHTPFSSAMLKSKGGCVRYGDPYKLIHKGFTQMEITI